MSQKMTKGNHRRKVVFVAIAIIVSLTTGLYIFATYHDKSYINLVYPNPGYGIRHDATIAVNITRNLKIQKDRLVQVRQTCEKFKNLMMSPGYAKHRAVFNAAPHYNWSYCKIGKIGSTLWTQFFYILHHEGETVKDVLVKCREDIHNMEGLEHTILGVSNSQCNSTRMILSARNPYTRLFSAYIDRMYISSTSISVRGEKDPKCKPEITFPEFLEYVVNNTRRGIFDYHWSPVFYLCKPCEINSALVFKVTIASKCKQWEPFKSSEFILHHIKVCKLI